MPDIYITSDGKFIITSAGEFQLCCCEIPCPDNCDECPSTFLASPSADFAGNGNHCELAPISWFIAHPLVIPSYTPHGCSWGTSDLRVEDTNVGAYCFYFGIYCVAGVGWKLEIEMQAYGSGYCHSTFACHWTGYSTTPFSACPDGTYNADIAGGYAGSVVIS